MLNKPDFLVAAISLELFLSVQCSIDAFMSLEIDKSVDIVFFGKPRDKPFLVKVDAFF